MKHRWLAALLVFASAGALIVWREWHRPSAAAETPRVVLFADLGEADEDEGCGAIIRGVREAAARGVAVQEIDARRSSEEEVLRSARALSAAAGADGGLPGLGRTRVRSI